MGKYILLAATKRDGGCRCWHKGDWRATKYVLYSDGTCYRTMECVEEPPQTKIFRMNTVTFEKLRDLLKTQFDGVQADWGCDGVQWEMHHYAPGGRRLHSIRGHIYGVPALEEIGELLAKH